MRRFASMLLLAAHSVAQEPKQEPAAAITALEPAALVAGGTATLKVRGFKLKDATEIRFPKAPGVKAVIKEKKDAAQRSAIAGSRGYKRRSMHSYTLEYMPISVVGERRPAGCHCLPHGKRPSSTATLTRPPHPAISLDAVVGHRESRQSIFCARWVRKCEDALPRI